MENLQVIKENNSNENIIINKGEINMNNEIKIFSNEEFGNVRTVMINNEPYFVGKDVAEILGYKNTRDTLSKHVNKDDKGSSLSRHPWWNAEYDNKGRIYVYSGWKY